MNPIDQALVPITSDGSIVVTVTDAATSPPGPPPLDFCRFVNVFEASAIGIGLLWPLQIDGPYPFSGIHDGDYKVVLA